MYYIYVWSIINGVEVGITAHASKYIEDIWAVRDTAEKNRYNWRIIKNSTEVDSHVW